MNPLLRIYFSGKTKQLKPWIRRAMLIHGKDTLVKDLLLMARTNT